MSANEVIKRDARELRIDRHGRAFIDGKFAGGGVGQVKCTDSVIEKIVGFVESGNYLTVSCAAAGVSHTSLKRWRRLAEKVDAMYPELELDDWLDESAEVELLPAGITPTEWQAYKLFHKMALAEARAEAWAVLAVRKHMPDQWTAAMTYLERRFPDRWRKRQTIETAEAPKDQLDETAVIEDPHATHLIHEALAKVARTEPAEVIEASAEDVSAEDVSAEDVSAEDVSAEDVSAE